MLLNETTQSVVLRTVWRVKKMPLGSPGNTRPDYQQLLTGKTEKSPSDWPAARSAKNAEDRTT
jgi:hypothetical protein